MGSGRSSRLYESLVRQQQVAVQAGAGVVPAKGPTFMYLEGMAGPGKDPAAVEKAIYAEVEKIQNGPIQEWELDKARNAARRSLVGSLGSSLQRAILLARYTVFYNDPAIINTRYERIASLKIEDLQRVARQYLVPANRAVVVTVPAKQARSRVQRCARCKGCGRCASEDAFCSLPSALCSVSGAARRAGAGPRPGRRGSSRATGGRAVQEPRAGQQRRHQGEAAARAGNAALERRVPDGARRSPRPLGAVRDHHDRRRRLLRSRPACPASPTRPRR